MAVWKFIKNVFRRRKSGGEKKSKSKSESESVKMVDASTQTEIRAPSTSTKSYENTGRELLRQLQKESSLMDFFARRGKSWPSRESLPWTVKMNNLYPDLSEFQ